MALPDPASFTRPPAGIQVTAGLPLTRLPGCPDKMLLSCHPVTSPYIIRRDEAVWIMYGTKGEPEFFITTLTRPTRNAPASE